MAKAGFMHVVVLFESLFGNTREVAEAIADGARTADPKGSKAEGFIIEGTEGPLRAGEPDRTRAWGANLVQQTAG
jgi:hypothetical protein